MCDENDMRINSNKNKNKNKNDRQTHSVRGKQMLVDRK